jgi:hypothetical protein
VLEVEDGSCLGMSEAVIRAFAARGGAQDERGLNLEFVTVLRQQEALIDEVL